jgi:hypothetical protein
MLYIQADFVAIDLEAVSNSFFERFSECSLGLTLRLAFFEFSRVLRLRSKLSSSFLEFRGFDTGRKLPILDTAVVLRL